MELFDNAVRQQVYSVPPMVGELLPVLTQNVTKAVEGLLLPQKLILSGCGDCYCAALSVKPYIAQWLQMPVEVVTSLELSRGYPAFGLKGALVVLLSKSGSAARIVEAAERMGNLGIATLAVTSKEQSPLALHCGHLLHLPIPPFQSAPGVRSYTAMTLGLYLLAAAFCGQWGCSAVTVADGAAKVGELTSRVAAMLPEWDATALELAESCKDFTAAEFIGGGSDLGSAYFGYAKVYEAAGITASWMDCEDWFHINYFSAIRNSTLTMIFDHMKNPAATRTRELITKLNSMEMPFALVTDDTALQAEHLFSMPQCEPWLTPFCQYAAPALAAAYLAVINNRPFNCGFTGPWSRNPEAPGTTNSLLQIIE